MLEGTTCNVMSQEGLGKIKEIPNGDRNVTGAGKNEEELLHNSICCSELNVNENILK